MAIGISTIEIINGQFGLVRAKSEKKTVPQYILQQAVGY